MALDLALGCSVYGPGVERKGTRMDMVLLYFDGCPSWQLADQHLRTLADEHGFEVTYLKVETTEAAEELAFRGSPTLTQLRKVLARL